MKSIPAFIKFSLLAALALMLAGCDSISGSSNNVSAADMQKRQQALAASDLLIVPGGRIGPVRLGMGLDEVFAKLGQPDYINPGTEDRLLQWQYWSLNLNVDFDNSAAPAVVEIANMDWTNAPLLTIFRTDKGIGIGSTSFDVQRAYGRPSTSDEAVMIYEHL
jgi:hypothetical protein